MKLEKGKIGGFEVSSIKKNLREENKYIMNLWKRIPGQNSSDIKEAGVDIAEQKNKSGKLFAPNRAHTLKELKSKLEELKGKSHKKKSKNERKKLKNKISKLKLKDSRHLKKTLLKISKEPRDVKIEVKPPLSKPAKPVFNSEGKMVFNKFDFAESPSLENDPHNKKETKDPHKLLKKIEKQKEKLKQLEEKGEIEKVEDIKEKQAWKSALQKAKGIKIKDDPHLLQKTLKKKYQKKKKSQSQWKSREKKVQKEMKERQQKRQANIEEHSKKRRANRVKHLVKKGRIIPGL